MLVGQVLTPLPLAADVMVCFVQIQGFAYIMLIVLARPISNSETSSTTDDNEESGYLLASVTGAMYLLVASTSQDLRAGFSLLADGSCTGHRAFGLTLITVYGTMISAAMTVLVSTSQDSASVVLNAVTVLFIADLVSRACQATLCVFTHNTNAFGRLAQNRFDIIDMSLKVVKALL